MISWFIFILCIYGVYVVQGAIHWTSNKIVTQNQNWIIHNINLSIREFYTTVSDEVFKQTGITTYFQSNNIWAQTAKRI